MMIMKMRRRRIMETKIIRKKMVMSMRIMMEVETYGWNKEE
jgi:hypothetical protein